MRCATRTRLSLGLGCGAARWRIIGLLPIVLCVLIARVGSAQVVLVEDFESPDTGNFMTCNAGETLATATKSWDVTVSGVDLFEGAARAEAAAFDGAQAIDLAGSPGAGVIETTFTTLPGEEYDLVSHYARNDLLGAETGDAQVDVIGSASLL